eukprot:1159221-Pelagomonas_calceolata.AAC.13
MDPARFLAQPSTSGRSYLLAQVHCAVLRVLNPAGPSRLVGGVLRLLPGPALHPLVHHSGEWVRAKTLVLEQPAIHPLVHHSGEWGRVKRPQIMHASFNYPYTSSSGACDQNIWCMRGQHIICRCISQY